MTVIRGIRRWSADPRLVSLALVVLVACSRTGNAAEQRELSASRVSTTTTAGSAAPTTSGSGKTFGQTCVDGAECATGVCFHKRIKGADAGPERRDVHPEAEEHEGFCSMKCDSDGDCPVPPTRGRCGARGMCK